MRLVTVFRPFTRRDYEVGEMAARRRPGSEKQRFLPQGHKGADEVAFQRASGVMSALPISGVRGDPPRTSRRPRELPNPEDQSFEFKVREGSANSAL